MWTCSECENSYDQNTGDVDERICNDCMEREDDDDKMKCSICKHNDIPEYGNNAEPINDGECCNYCNDAFVIPRRLQDMLERMNPEVNDE